MSEITKIVEYKGSDFIKGLSAQGNLAVDGLFQAVDNIDPFEQMGLLLPSLTPASITPSPSVTPVSFVSWNDGAGNPYVYAQSATSLIRINRDTPYTQSDQTAQVTNISASNSISWDSLYVYAGTSLRSNAFPVAIGSDVQIAGGFNGTMNPVPLCIGLDKNLYVGQDSRVGMVAVTSHTWTSVAFSVDGNFSVRDMVNDGNYLVIFADNNKNVISTALNGDYKCKIYFWSMEPGVTLADSSYEIDGAYIIGAKMLGTDIYFFTNNGLYVCNSATPPTLIRRMTETNDVSLAKPSNMKQMTVSKGSLYWMDGSNNALFNGKVYAYGAPFSGIKKLFYQPYDTSSSATYSVIEKVGSQFWLGNNTPKIFVANTGTTRGTGRLVSLETQMEGMYQYEYTKVVLSSPLSTGQSVTVSATGQYGSKTISASETKSYNATNPKQELIFRINPSANSSKNFENIRVSVSTTGAFISRVCVYARPTNDIGESL